MINRIPYIIILVIALVSCVEEIPLETNSFESVLVVEATITNENKHQELLYKIFFLSFRTIETGWA